MSLFSTPVCSVFIVCCLCTMVNCFQPKKKKNGKTANTGRRGLNYVAYTMEEFICGGEERDPECSFDDPDVDLLLLTVALCFFPPHGGNINLFSLLA